MEEITMETKPIMIAMNEFKESIVNTINNSNMLMAIVNLLLKDILLQCTEVEKQQYETAVQQYTQQTTTESVEKVDGEVVDKSGK